MKKKIFIINLILLSFITVFLIPSSAKYKDVESMMTSLLHDKYFENTTLAISVFDFTSNKMLFNLNEKKLLHPASVMKIITCTAGLEYLGTDYNFETFLYHSGNVVDSVCYGDIYIVGGFDPEFTENDLDTLVYAIKEYGIREINGNLYADISNMDSIHWGNGWMWDDQPTPILPYLYPLAVNQGCLKIDIAPAKVGQPTKIELYPKSKYFKLENNSITTAENNFDITVTRNWVERGNNIVISGNMPKNANQTTRGISIVNPVHFFMFLTKQKFIENSIKFKGVENINTLPHGSSLIYTKKRNLKKVVSRLLKRSDTFAAEMVLRALGLKYFNKPSSAPKGVQMIDSLITKIGLNHNNYEIVDGSGISHYNLVTAELFIELFKYLKLKSPKTYEFLYESFPISGVDGTLACRVYNSDALGNIHAKTGTIRGASSIAGFLKSADDHELGFAIFIQNFVGDPHKARHYQDIICGSLSKMVIGEIKQPH